jgi:hypothetical protein
MYVDLWVALSLFTSATPVPQTVDRSNAEVAVMPAEPRVFVGRVVGPEGGPREGAVVVTSAGGEAVTDARGEYRPEANVPPDARSVRRTRRSLGKRRGERAADRAHGCGPRPVGSPRAGAGR